MSIKVMTLVWENSKHRGTELLLMLSLADFANDDGEAYPGTTRLSKKCRVSTRSVQRAITRCVANGELSVFYNEGIDTGRGKTNLYKINMKKLTGDKMSPVTQATPQGVTQATPQGVTQATPKPSVEPSVEPSVNNLDANSQNGNEKPLSPSQLMFSSLTTICEYDLKLLTQKLRGVLNQTGKKLRDANISPADLEGFGRWWYANDWRGQKGQPPTPSQVVECWGQYKNGRITNGTRPIQDFKDAQRAAQERLDRSRQVA